MNHSIKINHSLSIAAAAGAHTGPVTARAILNQIPDNLYDSLTSRELAAVYQAMQTAHRSGRHIEHRDILAEGAIWNGSRMVELAS